MSRTKKIPEKKEKKAGCRIYNIEWEGIIPGKNQRHIISTCIIIENSVYI